MWFYLIDYVFFYLMRVFDYVYKCSIEHSFIFNKRLKNEKKQF